MRTVEVRSLEELALAIPKNVKLVFVADVGATNTRVSFVSFEISNSSIVFFKARASSVQEMSSLFQKTSDFVGDGVTSRVVAAAVAVPGPVTDAGSVAVVANFKADNTEGRTIRAYFLPKRVCPLGRTRLLNDLHACGAGIVCLNHIGAFGDSFERMWGPKQEQEKKYSSSQAENDGESSQIERPKLGKGSCVVLAPGTGLGTALLHYNVEKGSFTVVPLEFGHTHISTFKHDALMSTFVKKLNRGNNPAEFDDVCTGRGLEHIYRVSREQAGSADQKTTTKKNIATAPEISKAASEGDIHALVSFNVMYAVLMNLASQLAMGFVPATIVIAGDNAVRHNFYFSNKRNVDHLHEEFKSHTMERMGFMSRVQVCRQNREANLNLIGAAFTAATGIIRKQRTSHL